MSTLFEKAFQTVERPFAWVDFDAIDQNIEFVKKQCGEMPVRVATKSVRSLPLLLYIKERLPYFAGWMTFTAAESLFLLEQGLDDILLGYPVYEEVSVKRIFQFIRAGRRVTFMVDKLEHLTFLERIGEEEGIQARVCVDLNLSNDLHVLYFGTHRSSLDALKPLDAFIGALQKAKYIIVDGVMGYEAQIAGVPDIPASPIKGAVIRQLQKLAKGRVTTFRRFAVSHLKAYFPEIRFVNGGGSGSMSYTARQREVSEVTVGSAFFAPALFDGFTSLALQPATGFALRITRKPNSNIVVCHGGGYVASGAAGVDRLPVFYEKGRYSLLPLEGAGEVQTPIRVLSGNVEIGDTIYFRHAKAGELCERFTVLHGVRNGKYVGSFSTYRGDGQCFL